MHWLKKMQVEGYEKYGYTEKDTTNTVKANENGLIGIHIILGTYTWGWNVKLANIAWNEGSLATLKVCLRLALLALARMLSAACATHMSRLSLLGHASNRYELIKHAIMTLYIQSSHIIFVCSWSLRDIETSNCAVKLQAGTSRFDPKSRQSVSPHVINSRWNGFYNQKRANVPALMELNSHKQS